MKLVKLAAGCFGLCELLLLISCNSNMFVEPYTPTVGGNPHAGVKVMESYGCGACHTIPGVHAAYGDIGPPLAALGRRTMIAGEMPNTPDNLVHWLEDPPSIENGTAMPKLGLTDQQARDVAAYLYTLH